MKILGKYDLKRFRGGPNAVHDTSRLEDGV